MGVDRNIVLIGYRGTGKTVVGRALAQRLDRAFFDADVLIEERAGRTIQEMVCAEGWPFFRAREKEALRELAGKDNCVLAPGGGAVMDPDNVAFLGDKGWFVLLKADLQTVIQRIQADTASSQQRPDLLGGDIYQETQALLRQRMPVYEKVADTVVDTSELTIDQVVDRIVEEFRS